MRYKPDVTDDAEGTGRIDTYNQAKNLMQELYQQQIILSEIRAIAVEIEQDLAIDKLISDGC
jgi:SepF-like predicted cell division protein (DUF552 family)